MELIHGSRRCMLDLNARPSEQDRTVELRVAHVSADVDVAALVAGPTRALAQTASREAQEVRTVTPWRITPARPPMRAHRIAAGSG